MAEGRFVVYTRVSTDRQGRSGLGLDAQKATVASFLNGGAWTVMADFVEVESGSNCERPKLAEAIRACRAYGAKLLIAKLDRLSRDAHFLLGLEKAGVDFVAADMPTANRLTVGIMAMVAEEERRAISRRTTDALAQAKARGVQLGGWRGTRKDGTTRDRAVAPVAAEASLQARQARAKARGADLSGIVAEIKAEGATSLGAIAKALTARGVETARGASTWSAMQVSRLLATIDG